ncbi:MAG: prolipoprotein diacylglyceryl transferase [Acidobacteriota bacterium]|nr:prolipoprotein diacylglyceryl transferase [Acidobacteriota bacterium]
MLPILVKIGPVAIHTYGFFMALGVGLGLWFLYVQSKKQGLDAVRLMDAAFYTIIASLVGAKLILFLGNFSYYAAYPKELFSLARSGGVFQGGLAFGVAFALWYFRRKKIPTWKTADVVGPALALGHGFGRIGCFGAGCCFGDECSLPWGVKFTSDYAHNLSGVPLNIVLHPVQLYEAALNFLNFLVLFLALRKKRFDGQVFSLYIINYSIIRFATEYFRGDHEEKTYVLKGASNFLSVSYPQLFCILGLAGGAALAVILGKRKSD